MHEVSRVTLSARNVRSLAWRGDSLVDAAAGGRIYTLDGEIEEPGVYYAYRFDAALVPPEGDTRVLFERLGTKGIVLRGKKIVREIDRSFYHAHVYEYPAALLRLPDGREVLAHCPDDYCKIELEDVKTGEILTRRDGKTRDFFHSRLRATPDGRYLLSAGWVWHPWDAVALFDIEETLRDPTSLDRSDLDPGGMAAELSSAVFHGSRELWLWSSEEEVLDDDEDEDVMKPGQLGVYDLESRKLRSTIDVEEPLGTMMPLGDHVLGFYEHPKLVEVATGKVVHRWPDLESGKQASSIIHHIGRLPALALDPAHLRFAIAGQDEITVIQLGR